MKKGLIVFFAMIFALCIGSGTTLGAEKILKMSTTTSTENSGLLDVLLPQLEKDTGIRVKVIAKGTGAAIKDGMDGNVDIIFCRNVLIYFDKRSKMKAISSRGCTRWVNWTRNAALSCISRRTWRSRAMARVTAATRFWARNVTP